MQKNKKTRIAGVLLALMLVLGIFPFSAFADQLYSNGELTTYLERDSGSGWTDYIQKDYRIGADGDIAYCLEGGKYFSESYQDTWADKGTIVWAFDYIGVPFRSGMNSEMYYEGLKYLLFWGYPNFIPAGLTAEQAQYATSAAIHWFSAWATGQNYTNSSRFGYSFWGECYPTANYSPGGIARMRPKAGVDGAEDVYWVASILFEEAAAGYTVDAYKSAELYKTNASQVTNPDGSIQAPEENGSYVSYITFHTNGAQQRPYSYSVSGVTGATVEEILPIRAENNIVASDGHPSGAHVWVDLKVTIPMTAENSDKIATLTANGRCGITDTSVAFSLPEGSYQSTISALIFSGTRYEEIGASINIKTPEKKKTITVTKASSDISLSPENNSSYTFSGTRFGIYRSQVDAESKVNAVEILDLPAGASSVTSSLIPMGDYWVRELNTSACYYLNEDVYEVSGEADEDESITITNVPKTDPASTVVIGKVDFSGQDKPITWSPAVFKVEYFDNYEYSGTPLRTWYFKTDDNGKMRMTAPLLAGEPYNSSAVYTNELNQIQIPLGSIQITEVEAPAGYTINTGSAKGTITLIGGMARFQWENDAQGIFSNDIVGGVDTGLDYLVVGDTPSYHRVNVKKNDGIKNGNTSMAGIVVSVTNTSGHTVYVKTGENATTAYANGEVVTTMTLDSDGNSTTGYIFPYGSYTLTETYVPEGSGFKKNESWSHTVVINESYDNDSVVEFDNDPKLFWIEVQKKDADTSSASAQGDASLAGAEITVVNRSSNPVEVNGTVYAVNAEIMTLVTDENGHVKTAAIFPAGKYELTETKASDGYDRNMEWKETADFTADKEDGTGFTYDLPQSVKRCTLIVVKWDADRGVGVLGEVNPREALEGIAFEVVNRSICAVMYQGVLIQPGEAIADIVTAYDEVSRTYRAGIGGLPYGKYEVRELYDNGAENLTSNRYYLVDDDAAVLATLHDPEAELDFTDTRINRLTVTKTVTGNMGNKEKVFDFELALGDNKGIPVRFEKTSYDGSVSSGTADCSSGSYAFTLRHGESITFSYIIGGNSYTLTELNGESDGYEVTYTGARSGTLDLDTTVGVRNTRQSIIPTGIETPIGISSAAAVIAALAIVYIVRSRKKEHNE